MNEHQKPPPDQQRAVSKERPGNERNFTPLVLPPKENFKVWQERQRLSEAIVNNSVVILAAGTGTGKTRFGTQIALEAIGENKRMFVTENLRKACEESAKVVATDDGTELGDKIGFQNKLARKFSAKTRMTFCPVQSLLIKMESDPLLKDVDLVFMDEVHKESKANEIAMVKLRDIQKLRKGQQPPLPELKLVLTSATADKFKLTEYFPKAAVVDIPGENIPIKVEYAKAQIHSKDLPKAAIAKVQESIGAGDRGNMLVFLSGRGQVDEVTTTLRGMNLQNAVIVPFYGGMNRAEQDKLLAEHQGKRVIIVATNAAQESLTLPINIVIDNCMHKHKEYDPLTGHDYLIEKKAPLDHLMQRQGRVGRKKPEPGCIDKYYALTTEDDYKGRDPHEQAEMVRTDLTSEILLLMANNQDPYNFAYINKPDKGHLDTAMKRLEILGAVKNGKITDRGKFMARLQVESVNTSAMIAAGMDYGAVKETCALAAMLEAYPDIPNKQAIGNSDLLGLVKTFGEYRSKSGQERKTWMETNGYSFQKMKEANDIYEEFILEVQAQKPSVDMQATTTSLALNKSIYRGFADSLMTVHGGSEYRLTSVANPAPFYIEKSSALADKNVPFFITANIRPQIETPKVTRRGESLEIKKRYASMNHEIPKEAVAAVLTPPKPPSPAPTPPKGVVAPVEIKPKVEPPKPVVKLSIWKRFTNWLKNFFGFK